MGKNHNIQIKSIDLYELLSKMEEKSKRRFLELLFKYLPEKPSFMLKRPDDVLKLFAIFVIPLLFIFWVIFFDYLNTFVIRKMNLPEIEVHWLIIVILSLVPTLVFLFRWYHRAYSIYIIRNAQFFDQSGNEELAEELLVKFGEFIAYAHYKEIEWLRFFIRMHKLYEKSKKLRRWFEKYNR